MDRESVKQIPDSFFLYYLFIITDVKVNKRKDGLKIILDSWGSYDIIHHQQMKSETIIGGDTKLLGGK